MTISAEGLVDPNDPRYSTDKALLQSDLRADAKSQLVAKALGLMVEPASLAKNYDLVRDKLLAQKRHLHFDRRPGEPAPSSARTA